MAQAEIAEYRSSNIGNQDIPGLLMSDTWKINGSPLDHHGESLVYGDIPFPELFGEST